MLFFFPKISQICPNLAKFCWIFNFRQIWPKFFGIFPKCSIFLKFRIILPLSCPYPAPYPPPIRNRRSFAGFWSRSVCCHLASSCARPAAALREKWCWTCFFNRKVGSKIGANVCWKFEVWPVHKHVNIADLAKSFPTSVWYLLAIGLDTADEDPIKAPDYL